MLDRLERLSKSPSKQGLMEVEEMAEKNGVTIDVQEMEIAKHDLAGVNGKFASWELCSGHFHTCKYDGDWATDFDYEVLHLAYCSKKENAYMINVLVASTIEEAIEKGILDCDGMLY